MDKARLSGNDAMSLLRILVRQGLDTICSEHVRKYFGKSRQYEYCYRAAMTNDQIHQIMKYRVYSSHRRTINKKSKPDEVNELRLFDNQQRNEFALLCSCQECGGINQCQAPFCSNTKCDQYVLFNSRDKPKTRFPSHVKASRKRPSNKSCIYALCLMSDCRKWREICAQYYRQKFGGNSKKRFTCQAIEQKCSFVCAACNEEPCECVCDECNCHMMECNCEDFIQTE